MRIDNSRAKAFLFCPLYYYEKYVTKIELDWAKVTGKPGTYGFGKRMHELLEEHYLALKGTPIEERDPHELPDVEEEAQVMIAAYREHYPAEPFDVVEVERPFEVALNERHTYTGKIDLTVRLHSNGMLALVDHKTERRGSKENHPEAWMAREQASRYLWAAEQIYGEPFYGLILNVLTRQSPAGEEPPNFPIRQEILRTKEQYERSLTNLLWVADNIERMEREFEGREWPRNSDMCKDGWKKCEFYLPHTFGRTPETLVNFKPTEDYLGI